MSAEHLASEASQEYFLTFGKRSVEHASECAGVRHMRGPRRLTSSATDLGKLVRAQSIVGILRPRSLLMCSLDISPNGVRRAR